MTEKEAADALRDYILKYMPRAFLRQGPRPDDFAYLHMGSPVRLCWGAAFGVEVSMEVSLLRPPTLSWPSTQRSLENALCCLTLYRQAVDFAVLVEAWRSQLVASVKGAKLP